MSLECMSIDLAGRTLESPLTNAEIAGFANAEHDKSQCRLVCCLTHSPELLKTGRFDPSTIISWQSSTIKRVVRSILAAEGYPVSEGLESAQWFRHLLTEAHMARSSLMNVEKV